MSNITLEINIKGLDDFTKALELFAGVISNQPHAQILIDTDAPPKQDVAAASAPQPVAPTPPPAAPAPVAQPATVPTTAPAYTQDQLALAASGLMDAGKLPELQALLQQFGVASLVELPKEQYGAFATALRGLGAQI